MISWLAPAVLGVGALVALPFAIHWLTRQRTVARLFPPLAFLARVDAGRSRRNRLRERFILLLRALAVLCLIAAAAGAVWRGQLGGGDQRPLVVVLDASASMRQEVSGATAWEHARASAGELLRSASGRPLAAVVAHDVPMRSGFEIRPGAGPALALLSEAEPGWGDGDPAAAIASAAALLPQGGDIILVSDLARSCLSSVDPATLPTGVVLTLVDCGPGPGATPDNLAVTSLEAEPGVAIAGRPLTVTARVANCGPRERTVPLRIQVGAEARTIDVVVPAGGSTSARIETTPTSAGWLDVSAAIPAGDVLAGDDQRVGMVAVRPELIAVVAGDVARDDPRGALRPLIAALSAAGFTVRSSDGAGLAQALDGAALCATAGLREPVAAAAALAPYLQAGGAWLQVIAGDGDAACLPTGITPPVALTSRLDLGEQGRGMIGLGHVRFDHALLSAFSGREALLSSIQAFRIRLTPQRPAADSAVLLAWADGTVAAAERPVGAGRWLMLNIGTAAADSSLAVSEAWPLLCARLPAALLPERSGELARDCGAGLPTTVLTAADGQRVSAVGNLVRPPRPGRWRDADSKPFGAAVPARESDLRPLDPRVLGLSASRAGAVDHLIADRPLWPWLLALAALLLGVELMLAGGVRR